MDSNTYYPKILTMKIFRLFKILFLLIPITTSAQTDFNVMSFNIRYNNKADSSNAWEYRKDKVSSQIKFYDIDILGIQEGLIDQVNDLKRVMISHEFVGAGRDDGKERGEFSGLFINSAKFKVISSGTFWLSLTPEVIGSKSWDAAITRVCTWALLRDKAGKQKFYVFNTHLDHLGSVSRVESIKLILSKIDEMAKNYPVILIGDMNSSFDEEPIKTITSHTNKVPLFNSTELSAEGHYGPSGTFNNFKAHEINDKAIDFIFVTKDFKVLKHATISESWEGHFSSDHFPVFAKLRFL
ncbi:MAG: endonuclease/exonuclease/phosphatase family protein [Bacteroidota bacterium]